MEKCAARKASVLMKPLLESQEELDVLWFRDYMWTLMKTLSPAERVQFC